MPIETLSRQQLRTRKTQARLLDAAEEVFVRDGYEAAQLDEIAARAGRSKGAVYTHFKSKEDLFLVLFEHRTRSYIDRLIDDLRKCTTPHAALRGLSRLLCRTGRTTEPGPSSPSSSSSSRSAIPNRRSGCARPSK